VALTDDDIQYLERRAHTMGSADRVQGGPARSDDLSLYRLVTASIDPEMEFGEHPSDLDHPNADDVRGVADAYRSGLHGEPRSD
jgi:hypothetical protein